MSFKRQIFNLLIFFLLTSYAYSELRAELILSGSSQSLFYSRENLPVLSNGDETDNFRYFQYLKMKLSSKGEKSSISFRTYLRVSDDLNTEYTDDSRWRLYNGYLQWDRGITSFSLGRQWLHLGPGSLTLDGLKVSIGSQGRHKLTGYIGTESPYSRSFGTLGWERARSGGIYFSTRPVSRADIGLGWYQKNRAGEVALREIGFNGKLRLPIDLDLSGRLDLNLLTDRVQKGIVRFSYRGIKRLSFTGEYKHYEPRLFYQSYFRRFKPEANDQVRGGIVFFLRPEVTLSTTYSAIFFEEESSSYLSLGASCPYGSVTYYRGDGYGGDENGFAVGASLPFAKKFELFADLDYSRYRFYEDEDRDYLFSSIFGINWQPRKDINASLEFEDFNNDAFSKDFRTLIKVAYNFSNVF